MAVNSSICIVEGCIWNLNFHTSRRFRPDLHDRHTSVQHTGRHLDESLHVGADRNHPCYPLNEVDEHRCCAEGRRRVHTAPLVVLSDSVLFCDESHFDLNHVRGAIVVEAEEREVISEDCSTRLPSGTAMTRHLRRQSRLEELGAYANIEIRGPNRRGAPFYFMDATWDGQRLFTLQCAEQATEELFALFATAPSHREAGPHHNISVTISHNEFEFELQSMHYFAIFRVVRVYSILQRHPIIMHYSSFTTRIVPRCNTSSKIARWPRHLARFL